MAENPSSSNLVNSVKEGFSAAIDMIWAPKIPMRDGVRPNGAVFGSSTQKEARPVTFPRTRTLVSY